jgi:ribosomal protein L37AE/L43A
MASLYAALMTYETGHHLARARTVGIASIRGALQYCEECSPPEMHRLPDGMFHCPACGSEVLPPKASGVPDRPQANSSLGVTAAGQQDASESWSAVLQRRRPRLSRSSHDYAAVTKSEPTPKGRKEKEEGGDKE